MNVMHSFCGWDDLMGICLVTIFDRATSNVILKISVLFVCKVAGAKYGLSVELHQNISEWQQICSGAYSGFKVIQQNKD